MSPESALLYTYGVYLSNGGTPQGFMDMTPEDIQLMYTVHTCEKNKEATTLLSGIAKILTKLMGCEE